MTKDDIRLLYEYDRWANNRVLHAASALATEQFTRDLGGGFRSVRGTLVHILGGEWGWLAYWKTPCPSAASLVGLWDRHDTLFRPDAFPNLTTLRLKWADVEREQAEFISGLTDEDLSRIVPFRSTHVRLEHLLQHAANHSTYHRGQVALMMREVGAEPMATDFHVFLVEGRSQAVPTD